ncbi:MAG: OmpA family protein [Polyangiales bacterium]
MMTRRLRPAAWIAGGLSLLASLAAAPEAAAQTSNSPPIAEGNGGGFDLHLFRPAIDSKGILTVNGTDILGAGGVSFGLLLDVGTSLGRIGTGSTALVESMFSGLFHANVGIGNLLVAGLQIPFHLVNGPANSFADPMNTSASGSSLGLGASQFNPGNNAWARQGLGDIILHAKLRWLRAEYWPVGLAVSLQVGIPIAPISTQRAFAGEPGVWVWPAVAIERRFAQRLRLAANLGARIPFGDNSSFTSAGIQSGTTISYGPSLTFGVGASYRIGTVIDLMAEVYGAQYLNGFDTALATTPMEGILGAKIFVDRNSYLTLGGGAGFTPALASAGFRGFVGFIFEPSIGDTDGDGFRDDVDRCVNEPEDFDNFEDEDGCPEPDNDRDGIPDTDDQCPLVPEDRNGNQDSDGCPDSEVQDRDGDQIADNVDRCPDEPEDRDGFEDENGCPDPDNDQDQILDNDDLCPNEAEDRDGFEDDNGCPDPDNDHDNIPDTVDRCPNEAEVYNGLDDADGCPDNGLIRRVGEDIQLNQQIQFQTDSAQIIDNELNRQIIEQVGQLLAGQADITLVEVEGHTDERAADDHNLQLSRDRANSVVQALIQRGVAAERLVPAGYGEFCPVDPRSNEEAWARNRRVQFKIISIAGARTRAAAGCARGRQYIPGIVGAPAQ